LLILSEDTVTQQYGFLKFDENKSDESTRFSQYIRLALQTNAEIVVRFMREAWRLPTPDLIISVTGGAKNFELPARLRKSFQLGLVSVAATTSKSNHSFFFFSFNLKKKFFYRCMDNHSRNKCWCC
jgi:hypothetical protein